MEMAADVVVLVDGGGGRGGGGTDGSETDRAIQRSHRRHFLHFLCVFSLSPPRSVVCKVTAYLWQFYLTVL